jgi:2-keto-3-deoxy-L-rhamnonate aldolase RhmA
MHIEYKEKETKMMQNRLKEQLKNGKILFGICNLYPASGIIEGIGTGWDFIWLDGQHGEHTYESIFHGVQTAFGMGMDTIIRTSGYEEGMMGRYADIAPSAIMIPMVDSGEQARKAVEALRFAPLGKRSFGGRRVIDLYGRNYHVDHELLVIAQIETKESLQNLYDIIHTQGIDALFFSADDLRLSMGMPMNTSVIGNKELEKAMEATAKAAVGAGKFCGCVAASNEMVKITVDMGYRLLVGGTDSMFLRTGSVQKLGEMKEGLIVLTGK